jgi:hypothetical protein
MDIMIKNFLLIALFLFSGISNCDSQKKESLVLNDKQFACYVLAICTQERGVKFGMVGDSWTDLLYGTNFIETFRIQLEKYNDYKIVGATLGGETIAGAISKGSHLRVIDNAGSSIKYMLLSLGGNDIQGDPGAYKTNGFTTEKNSRFTLYKQNLRNMIATGNAYKISKYGGEPLLWIIHGYDFASPDNGSSTTCRSTLITAGYTTEQINGTDTSFSLPGTFIEFNELLKTMTTEQPYLRYIDLRYTLGATVANNYTSTASLYLDCIHPNSVGFRIIGEKYATILKGYTNNER